MANALQLHTSYEDYVRMREQSPFKLEYLAGEIVAMAGGTPEHSFLAAGLIRIIGNALSGGCRVASSDLAVRVEARDRTFYPDASVVCGKLERSPVDKDAVTNPVLIAEVSSPGTIDYDRGEKLALYKLIPSVQEIMLVSHEGPRIELYRRAGDGWKVVTARGGEILELESVGVRFDVGGLYELALGGL